MAPCAPFIERCPRGWYALCFSDELKPGETLVRSLMGCDVQVGRTCLGAVVLTGVDNRCAQTWPVRETDGIVLVHPATQGSAPPRWAVPPVDAENWSAPMRRQLVLPLHVAESERRGVSLEHLALPAAFRAVHPQPAVRIDGLYLTAAFEARLPASHAGLWWATLHLDFEFEVHVYGPGYLRVEMRVPRLDIAVRWWALPTPIDADHVVLYLAASGHRRAGATHPWLCRIPRSLRTALITRGLLSELVRDIQQSATPAPAGVHRSRPARRFAAAAVAAVR